MPIHRDSRTNRRRRVLIDSAKTAFDSTSQQKRSNTDDELTSGDGGARRTAGYSQDVRKACGQRLVQLIPVRKSSFCAIIAVSCLLPSALMAGHYVVYVTDQFRWYGHPLALVLDASHPQSIAAWLSSHLWLLCLGATILTFQLRRHKLDDYNGEYRLWFWMVLTCLFASIDSTTHVSALFGMALDRWSQVNLGWSGTAVVNATLASLIGMLGLRLCTELKSVPLSLIFWLGGLASWAGSFALSQPQVQIDMTIQFRHWLMCALWLGGLTSIWLAAVSYLRHVYIEAQKRFLLRNRLASSNSVPLGQRLRNAVPSMPRFRSRDEVDEDGKQRARWQMPTILRRKQLDADEVETPAGNSSRTKGSIKGQSPSPTAVAPAESAHAAPGLAKEATPARRGLGGFFNRRKDDNSEQGSELERPKTSTSRSSSAANAQEAKDPHARAKRSWPKMTGWLRKPKDDDEAIEYRKVNTDVGQGDSSSNVKSRTANESNDEQSPKRLWIPKMPIPRMPIPRMPSLKAPKLSMPKIPRPKGRLLPKLSLPKFGLAALQLKPPPESDDQANTPRKVDSSRALPGTNANEASEYDGEEDSNGRPLTKAERKRLRRLQQQNRAA